MSPGPGILTGTVAAAATVAAVLVLPDTAGIVLVAILLGLAAGVYPGLAMGREAGETALQWGVALLFALVALAGLWFSPWVLALGWIGHAGWDLLHHAGRLRTRAGSYPSACLVYDLVVGGLVIVRWAI